MNSYNYKSVIAQLQMQSSLVDWAGEEERIKHLCALACLRTATKGYVEEIEDEPMQVQNGLLELPKESVRLLRVRTMKGDMVRYNYEDGAARIRDYVSLAVLVDYWAIPLDEDSLPKITLKQLDYCVATCEHYYMRDKWLEQKINNSQYGVFQEAMKQAYSRAMKKKITVDEMEGAAWLMRNGLYYKNFDVLKTL